jgi:hypothetical protein
MHPVMIAMKRRMISVVKALIETLISDGRKLKREKISLDIRDENRGTLLHHGFTLWQENPDQARDLCQYLLD